MKFFATKSNEQDIINEVVRLVLRDHKVWNNQELSDIEKTKEQ